MKLQGLAFLGLLALGGSALAEGGCDPGYTPVNNGQNWTCIPGGNDSPADQPQRNTPSRPTGYWEKTWGAIAADGKNGILGAAVGAKSETEAKRIALSDCRAKGGGCKVELAYRNQCAVLVTGDKVYNAVSSDSIERATSLSMKECKSEDSNCRVYYSACTEPIYHQY